MHSVVDKRQKIGKGKGKQKKPLEEDQEYVPSDHVHDMEKDNTYLSDHFEEEEALNTGGSKSSYRQIELNQPNKDLNIESGDTVATIASIFGHNDEKRRRLRLYGRGVTCTQLKQRAFEEQLKKKRDEEVKAIAAEYEEKRKKDKVEVSHVLRFILSQLQQH